MSKVIGFVIGAVLIAAGIATGNPALIIQGGLMIVSQAVMDLTAPKVPARQAAELTLQLGEQSRSGLLGEAFTAGSLVDGFNYGGKYGTDWECLLIRLADHKCAGLTGFYVDDTYVPYAGNGNYPQFDGSHFELYFRADTTNDPLPSVLTANGPGWTSADIGESGCDVLVCYRADAPDAENPAWPGGRPRFGFVVKGKLCYDPRLDSTVPGGSGAHRWTDPSTWEWSDNPSVCRYNWVRGIYANDDVADPTALLVGRGLSDVEAPPENVFAPANLCDEMVAGEKRFRVAGPVYASQPFIEVEEMFASATAGIVVTRQGSVELEPGQGKAVVASFTDDDLVSGTQVGWNQSILSDSSGEWVNTVVARYVEPAQKWADHAAPVVRDTADVIADGGPREMSLTLRLVKWVAQAQRCAEVFRRLGRIWGRGTVTLGPRFCELEDGDWVNWTSKRRLRGATKTFRVEAYSIDKDWRNKLTLRQINSTVFSEGTFDPDLSEVNPSPVPPAIGAPDVAAWTLAAATLTSGGAEVSALVVTGACEDPLAQFVRFETWRDDGVTDPADVTDWSLDLNAVRSVTRREITSVAPGADYYVAVSYVVDNQIGDRLILGPATAPENVGTITQLIDTSKISGLTFTVGVPSGGNSSVTISDHSRKYNDKAAVSVTGTGGSPASVACASGDLLLCYYDDAARAGGAVSYQFLVLAAGAGDTTPAYPSQAHPYRHLVFVKYVPAAGGNTGGGSGAGSGGGGGGGGTYPIVSE